MCNEYLVKYLLIEENFFTHERTLGHNENMATSLQIVSVLIVQEVDFVLTPSGFCPHNPEEFDMAPGALSL